MTNNAKTTTDTTATPASYELLQTRAFVNGGGNSYRNTFKGSADIARKERIARFRKYGTAHMLEGNAVTYAERNGDQVRLEWVQL